MANNNIIFNAVLSGSIGAMQAGRWIRSTDPATYAAILAGAEALADEIDSLIATDSNLGQQQADLMQSICVQVIAGRIIKASTDFTRIAQAIVALYTECVASLLSVSGGGGLPITTNQVVYVSKAGSAGGNGQSSNPVLTIAQAMALILDASPTKRYAVVVSPGNYADDFALKANVFVRGIQRDACRITAVNITLDSTWTPAGDHRSGIDNMVVTGGAKTFDFNAVSSNEGKLFFRQVSFSQKPRFDGFSNINQVTMDDCTFFAGFTQNNCTGIYNALQCLNAGSIDIVGLAAHSLNALFYGGGTDGVVNVNQSLANPTPVEIDFYGFAIAKASTLNLTGANITCNANPGCLPATINLAGGATSPRPVVTGAKGGNAALTSLMPALQTLGIVTDSTTA